MLPNPPTYDTPDLRHIDGCLRLLDGFLLVSANGNNTGEGEDEGDTDKNGGGVRDSLLPQGEELVRGLFALCVVAQILLSRDEEGERPALIGWWHLPLYYIHES